MNDVTTQAGQDRVEPVEPLVLACIEAGVKLSLKDGQLSVKAPRETDVGPLVQQLRTRRDDLVAYLRRVRAEVGG